jgi:hypothetical protein
MTMLNHTAINGFRDILQETCEAHGWTAPATVIEYTVKILADKLDKNPWQPEPSYAERYMTLRTPSEALELGNTCWFTRAVFPELLERRGIKSSYFVDLGQGCYSLVLKHTPHPAVRILREHFEFTAEIAHTAVRHYGDFRELWDL